MFYIILAIINALFGMYFIQIGIKKNGKKEFFKDMGYFYIFWVCCSTIIIMIKGYEYY